MAFGTSAMGILLLAIIMNLPSRFQKRLRCTLGACRFARLRIDSWKIGIARCRWRWGKAVHAVSQRQAELGGYFCVRTPRAKCGCLLSGVSLSAAISSLEGAEQHLIDPPLLSLRMPANSWPVFDKLSSERHDSDDDDD